MNDPRRWRDDPASPPELVKALQSAARVRTLEPELRGRIGARIGRLSMVPVTAAAWFTVKSAAAIGIAAGVATASAVAVVERHVAESARPPEPPAVAARAKHVAPRPRKSEVEPAPPERAAEAPAPESPLAPIITPPPRAASAAPGSVGLLDETALLERARGLLASRPEAALALSRDHARRFPGGSLARERELIQVDALSRLGRVAEARALAQRALAQGPGDLYRERLERLLATLPAP